MSLATTVTKQRVLSMRLRVTALAVAVLAGSLTACAAGSSPSQADNTTQDDRGVVDQSTTTAYSPTSTEAASTPEQTTSVASAVDYSRGAEFDDYCVVNAPAAPQVTSTAITMIMGCQHVDQNQFFYTEVVYGDRNLAVTPSTGPMHVVGQVIDTARSSYGYNVLEVQASKITLGG